MKPRQFLDLRNHDRATLRAMLDHAARMKADWHAGNRAAQQAMLPEKVLAMVFEKPSTRTRVSFDVGMRQLGGQTICLSGSELQMGRGESISDTAKVLSRYVDAIMLRTTSHQHLLELSAHATVPVINGLTDYSHPCQIMADILTFEERRGTIQGKHIAWCGDGNNVTLSWIHAAAIFGFTLFIATPKGYEPDRKTLDWAKSMKADIRLTNDPVEAVTGADCVVTDTWVSMGDQDAAQRVRDMTPFQVTTDLMARAGDDALFMHCLPAHRGEEVVDAVIDGPASVVFDEAENRLHAQKAVIAWSFGV
ncbi:MAG: ornithine carbamoyltransferase [Fimbriimonadaceae bacterium]|nr:ornithine carbamoyltransferase [Alphaproteobacteria bacterium]